ncbi:50S ribosome-binding GTPase [Maribius pontilimi]|uniref:50S ribosome-binding GTPase n=2 Tax=Palleronia pontilimi TaxID=1964209 RepID=A0A934IHS1_9RHOB|nr:50S ribosome-binding GTPase [Palleronia pontilimi]
MVEHGWLILFIVTSISFGGALRLVRLALAWWQRRRAEPDAPPPEKLRARIDPDWSASDRRAFEAARLFIDERTSEPLPWDQLQPVALEVIRRVADASGHRGKGVLDFSVPEALLLVDRVAVRLRADLRDRVPFVDSVRVGTLVRLWNYRHVARHAAVHGRTAWRVYRAVKSLPVAILREVEGVIAEGHASLVTEEGTAVLQGLLLEEVAVAAVDLYSGRLRFSDAELLGLRRAAGEADLDRLASPDKPLRIAVAGQVSAGKSSLINALVGADVAETDAAPTTEHARTHVGDIDGVAVLFLDLPGLDGTQRVTDAVLKELVAADLVLWTIRANRPAREIDRATLARFYDHFATRPARRMPPVIPVVTCVDAIVAGWPFPENLLDEVAMARVTEIVKAVAREVADGGLHPVPVSLVDPSWNLDALRHRISAQLGEALMAQRNRLRVETRKPGILDEAQRAGRGLRQGLSFFRPRESEDKDKS